MSYTRNAWAVGNPIKVTKLTNIEDALELLSSWIDLMASNMAIARFGGDPNAVVDNTALETGAALSNCHAGTCTVTFDSVVLGDGTYRLRAPMKSLGGGTVTLGLYNLTDSPNASPIATLVSDTDEPGDVFTSAALTSADFPAAGTSKTYGVKPLVSGAGVEGFCYEIELVRTA